MDSFNRAVVRAANHLIYGRKVPDPLLKAAAEIYLTEYDSSRYMRPIRQYVGPHVPPGSQASSDLSGNGD